MQHEIFESHHQVRAFECDYYGHVNNAIYLNYLEFARMEALGKKGILLSVLKEVGCVIVIRRIDILYERPAMVEDRLVIRTHLSGYRKVGGTFHQEIFRQRDQQLISSADVTWVTVNSHGRPRRIPEEIRRAFMMT